MIESNDAIKVVETLAQNLIGVAKNPANFDKLPDSFWGYFARGHDQKGKFGVIVTYTEKGTDVDELIATYQDWLNKNKTKN